MSWPKLGDPPINAVLLGGRRDGQRLALRAYPSVIEYDDVDVVPCRVSELPDGEIVVAGYGQYIFVDGNPLLATFYEDWCSKTDLDPVPSIERFRDGIMRCAGDSPLDFAKLAERAIFIKETRHIVYELTTAITPGKLQVYEVKDD